MVVNVDTSKQIKSMLLNCCKRLKIGTCLLLVDCSIIGIHCTSKTIWNLFYNIFHIFFVLSVLFNMFRQHQIFYMDKKIKSVKLTSDKSRNILIKKYFFIVYNCLFLNYNLASSWWVKLQPVQGTSWKCYKID